jgi:hypothetical protein
MTEQRDHCNQSHTLRADSPLDATLVTLCHIPNTSLLLSCLRFSQSQRVGSAPSQHAAFSLTLFVLSSPKLSQDARPSLVARSLGGGGGREGSGLLRFQSIISPQLRILWQWSLVRSVSLDESALFYSRRCPHVHTISFVSCVDYDLTEEGLRTLLGLGWAGLQSLSEATSASASVGAGQGQDRDRAGAGQGSRGDRDQNDNEHMPV